MTSPAAAHPPTPPADPSPSNATNTASRPQQPSSKQPSTSNITGNSAPNNNNNNNNSTAATTATTTQGMPTSTTDPGLSKRPRDARLIHLLLASLGVTAYAERVPLQLMDFSYRYTSSVLHDAQHLCAEGYIGVAPDGSVTYGGGGGHGRGGGASAAAASQDTGVGLAALRLAIGSRLHYQFQPGLPREVLTEIAAERNAVKLPGQGAVGLAKPIGPEVGGVRLPPERYVLSGRGWGLKEAWTSEGEEDGDGVGDDEGEDDMEEVLAGDDGIAGGGDEDGDGDDVGMEDVFGVDGAGHEDGDGDREMGVE